MTNLLDHIAEWLTSIGADGLMYPCSGHTHCYQVDEALTIIADASILVPAYRHADGSYHTEAEYPCPKCSHFNDAVRMCKCSAYVKWSSWLSRKGEGE